MNNTYHPQALEEIHIAMLAQQLQRTARRYAKDMINDDGIRELRAELKRQIMARKNKT